MIDNALVVVRRARPDDGPAVRRIVFGTLEAYGIIPDPDGKDRDVTIFGQPDACVDEFVAEIGGAVVGSVRVAPLESGEGWLSKFFVDDAFRGRGIGRLLLAHAVESARERGYLALKLDTRTFFKEAMHLYEATGWKRSPVPPPTGPCDALYTLDLR